MRIIVMSDTHRDFFAIQELVQKHQDAEIFIHLGDGASEFSQIVTLYPNHKFLNVRGNCDFGVEATLAGCFSCGIAKEVGANVVLFGHNHVPLCTYRDGIHLMNPGSLGMPRGNNPSYGVIDITEKEIVCFVNEL